MSDTEQSLCDEFKAWCEAQKLPHMSADELLAELDLDYAIASSDNAMEIGTMVLQKRYLREFIQRWDAVMEASKQ